MKKIQRINNDSSLSQIAAQLSFGLVIAFFIILIALHFLEPEFNTLGHLISEYELSRHSWMMSLAFFCLAGSSFSLLLAINNDLNTKSGTIGKWWLLLISLSYLGAGIFTPNGATGLDRSVAVKSSIHGSLHTLFGEIVIFTSPIVFTLLVRSLVNNQQWFKTSHRLRWMIILTWIGLISFVASLVAFNVMKQPTGLWIYTRTLVSLCNRFMMLTYCIWLTVVAWHEMRIKKQAS